MNLKQSWNNNTEKRKKEKLAYDTLQRLKNNPLAKQEMAIVEKFLKEQLDAAISSTPDNSSVKCLKTETTRSQVTF